MEVSTGRSPAADLLSCPGQLGLAADRPAGGRGRGRGRLSVSLGSPGPREWTTPFFLKRPLTVQAKGPFTLTFLQGLARGRGAVTGRVASSGESGGRRLDPPWRFRSYFLTTWLGAVSQLCSVACTSIPAAGGHLGGVTVRTGESECMLKQGGAWVLVGPQETRIISYCPCRGRCHPDWGWLTLNVPGAGHGRWSHSGPT